MYIYQYMFSHLLIIVLSGSNIFNDYRLEMENKRKQKDDLFALIKLGNTLKVKSFLDCTSDEENQNYLKEPFSTLIDSKVSSMPQSSLFSCMEIRKKFIDDLILFEPLLHYCVDDPRPHFRYDKFGDSIDDNSSNDDVSQGDKNQNKNIVNNGPEKNFDEERKILIKKERLQIAKYLLDLQYPSINLETMDSDGLTVLHLASKNGDYKILKLLLNYAFGNSNKNNEDGRIIPQFNINCQCLKLGWTPMHYSANQGDIISLKLLIQAGASASIKARPLIYDESRISNNNRAGTGSTPANCVGNGGRSRIGNLSITGLGITPLEMIKSKLQSLKDFNSAYVSNLRSVAQELTGTSNLIERNKVEKQFEKNSRDMKVRNLPIKSSGRPETQIESKNRNQTKLTHKQVQAIRKVASTSNSEDLGLGNSKNFNLLESAILHQDSGGVTVTINSGSGGLESTGLVTSRQFPISVKTSDFPEDVQVQTSGKLSAVALSVTSAVAAAVTKTGAVISKVLRNKSKKQMKQDHDSVVKFIPNVPLTLSSSSLLVPTIPLALSRVISISPCYIPPNAKKWSSNNNGLSPTSVHRIEVEKTLTWLCSRSNADDVQKKMDSPTTENNFKKNRNKLRGSSRSGSLGSHASTMSTTNSSLSHSSDGKLSSDAMMRVKQGNDKKGVGKEKEEREMKIKYDTTSADEKLSQLKADSLRMQNLAEEKSVSELL